MTPNAVIVTRCPDEEYPQVEISFRKNGNDDGPFCRLTVGSARGLISALTVALESFSDRDEDAAFPETGYVIGAEIDGY
ncbi:hypothetical protein [Methylobacterium mesophilicum]